MNEAVNEAVDLVRRQENKALRADDEPTTKESLRGLWKQRSRAAGER